MRARISFEYPQEVLDILKDAFKLKEYKELETVMRVLIAAELKDQDPEEFNFQFELIPEKEDE